MGGEERPDGNGDERKAVGLKFSSEVHPMSSNGSDSPETLPGTAASPPSSNHGLSPKREQRRDREASQGLPDDKRSSQ